MVRWTAIQILGGVIRWTIATIIAAVCLVWGFAPAEFFAGLWIDPPLWLSHPITRIAVLVVGMTLVVLIILKRHLGGEVDPHSAIRGGKLLTVANSEPTVMPSNHYDAKPIPPAAETALRATKLIEEKPPTDDRAVDEHPIEWEFGSIPTIFGWNEADDGTFLVGTFNIRGKNRSTESIINVTASVIPQVTSSPLTLRFYDPRSVDLLETSRYLIQPAADFQLSYKIPTYDDRKSLQGVPVEMFLEKFGALRFIFNYDDGRQFKHDFSFTSIENYLVKERRSRMRIPPPGIKEIL